MRSRYLKPLLFFIFIFFGSSSLSAQELDSRISLLDAIRYAETTYAVKFNYDPSLVENIDIERPSAGLSLVEYLDILQSRSGLKFRQMQGSFVLVSLPDAIVICGFLRDIEDNSILESATIQCGEAYAITNSEGYFELEIPDPSQEVEIRYLGYRNLISRVDSFGQNCEDVKMTPFFEGLEEVVISNYIVPGISKLNDGSLQIDITKFKLLPGLTNPDVLQTVQAFPGIISIDETVSNINIRGGSHDQNLINWDNVKMYQSGHFFGLISMYNPDITQKVSLVKNGSPADLTDGVSGTIAMNTSTELSDSLNAKLALDMVNISGFADLPLGDKSSLQIAARKSISDLVETPTYNKFFERISQDTEVTGNTQGMVNSNRNFDFYDTSLRWLYDISDKDKLRLNFINVSNSLEFDETAMNNSVQETRTSSLEQNSIAGGLFYNRKWSSKFSTDFQIYETDYKLKAINVNVQDDQRFLQENIVSETGLKISGNYQLKERTKLSLGYNFIETEVTNLDDVDQPRFRRLFSEVLRVHAVFTELDWRSKDSKTRFIGGLRFNYLDKFQKSIIEPRLNLSHRVNDHITLELLGEFKNQSTSQVINFQNDFLGIEKRRWQLSNDDDIPVITSRQASAGFQFKNKGWLVDLDAYLKKVNDITSQSQGFQNQYEFSREVGDYEAFGIDVLLSKEFTDIRTWLSYSFLDNTYDFPELQTTTFPSNFDVTHSVSFGMLYDWNDLLVSAGFNWRTGKPTTFPVEGNEIVDDEVNFQSANSSNLDDYLRIDVSALYEFNLGNKTRLQTGVSVWNVLDKENTIDNFFRIRNESVRETVQRSLGITPNAVFKVFF